MTGTPLPAPSQVTVSVANGTGVTNQAATTSAALGALGFHMMELGDTPPVGQEAETVVYYGSKKPAVVAAAQMVARSISGSVTLGYNPSEVLGGAEVTVDTGTSFSVNAPQAATTTPSDNRSLREIDDQDPENDDDNDNDTTKSEDKSTKSTTTTTTRCRHRRRRQRVRAPPGSRRRARPMRRCSPGTPVPARPRGARVPSHPMNFGAVRS